MMKKKLAKTKKKLGEVKLKLTEVASLNLTQANAMVDLKTALDAL